MPRSPQEGLVIGQKPRVRRLLPPRRLPFAGNKNQTIVFTVDQIFYILIQYQRDTLLIAMPRMPLGSRVREGERLHSARLLTGLGLFVQ